MTLSAASGNNHDDCCRRANVPGKVPLYRARSLPDRVSVFKPSYLIHRFVHRIVRENLPQGVPVMETPRDSAIVKRSVRIAGHATSISLEAAFWRDLCAIAAARQMPVSALVAAIDATRGGNLSSAIRLFVLDSARRGELTDPVRNAGVTPPGDGE